MHGSFCSPRSARAGPRRLSSTCVSSTTTHSMRSRQTRINTRPARASRLADGNAGNIGHRLNGIAALHSFGFNVLAVDYRGYGASEGAPSERGLLLDALAALELLRARPDIHPGKIALFGRSLGGAVALALVDHLGSGGRGFVCAVVLENTFLSIADIAADAFIVLRPLRSLLPRILWNLWESKGRIAAVEVPVLLLSAVHDEVIPSRHMRALYDLARQTGSKVPSLELLEFERGGHNSLPASAEDAERFYGGMVQFLSRSTTALKE